MTLPTKYRRGLAFLYAPVVTPPPLLSPSAQAANSPANRLNQASSSQAHALTGQAERIQRRSRERTFAFAGHCAHQSPSRIDASYGGMRQIPAQLDAYWCQAPSPSHVRQHWPRWRLHERAILQVFQIVSSVPQRKYSSLGTPLDHRSPQRTPLFNMLHRIAIMWAD